MAFNIALNFEDGVTRFITCEGDEHVADAAYRQKINLPMDCRDGVCGTCKCHCDSGSYELDFYVEDAMTEEEAAQRQVLTCQMRPQSDCVLAVPTTSLACKTAPQSVKAEVIAVDVLSDTSFSLRIKPAQAIAFLPGQFANVSIPGSSHVRAYSFSSHPNSQELSFLIRNIPSGIMSSYLFGVAKAGDALEVTGPMGAFYLRPVTRPLVLLAGGTGLAPFLSMLELLASTGTEQPIAMFYAVTRLSDLVEVERLQALQAKLPTMRLETIVADEASDHPKKGFVTAHLTAQDLFDGAADVYLCGPPPMVEAVRHHLTSLGVTPASFHFEKFNPAETRPAP